MIVDNLFKGVIAVSRSPERNEGAAKQSHPFSSSKASLRAKRSNLNPFSPPLSSF